MTPPIDIVQVGLGPLGQMLTPVLEAKSSLRVVSALDIDPELAGTDLADLAGAGQGVSVSGTLDDALAPNPSVAVVTTVSELDRLWPQIQPLVEASIHIVSTCEELSHSWTTSPDLSRTIDEAAKSHGVSVLGTGINPGFLMDFLPSAVTAVCRRIDSVKVERIQDASSRRLPFRQKIGAGLNAEEFEQRTTAGKIRHVGLTESANFIAAKLGWSLDRTEDVVEPVITDVTVEGDDWVVEPGYATGVNQTGRGFIGDREVITLVFRAAVGQSDPHDTVSLTGDPDYSITVPGGTHGDVATCAIIANAIPSVIDALPGLRTMSDIPLVSCAP
ncbi:MAG: dihydrodipicolinate reductase [Gemmatimonadetes bacterium]|nr:dihydrodipicolinate reductase [Gemmatimonadota bacterium]|tara:strand:+ start:129 stop:1121 length:993 start_codon:yes stop_codon:yes gene_type:complete